MIDISGANIIEKYLIKKVERATFHHFNQKAFFIIDITVVDNDTIKSLNKDTRGIDLVTDVLSFPSFENLKLPVEKASFNECDFIDDNICLGSVMICRQRAKEQALEYGHSYAREVGFLACHGLLHLLGFDHVEKEDEKIMIEHQHKIMEKIGLSR